MKWPRRHRCARSEALARMDRIYRAYGDTGIEYMRPFQEEVAAAEALPRCPRCPASTGRTEQ